MSRAERPTEEAGRPAPISRRRLLQAAGLGALAAVVGACAPGETSEDGVRFKIEGEIRLPTTTPTEGLPTQEQLQQNLPRIFPVKVQISETPPPGPLHIREEKGWKWVLVQLGFENAGNEFLSAGLTEQEIETMSIQTSEGFRYETQPYVCSRGELILDSMSSPWRTPIPREDYEIYRIPPGFRVKGVNRGWDERDLPAAQTCFKVAQNTSGYKLSIQGFPEIDLEKELAMAEQMKFPTDRPDSDFREIGETITIPGKGKVTLLEVRTDGYKLRFENASQGYSAAFKLKFSIFDTNGTWWFIRWPAWREVGPGVAEEHVWDLPSNVFNSPRIPQSAQGGKLLVSGDVNEIFNLRF